MEIIESNKMIALFDGLVFIKKTPWWKLTGYAHDVFKGTNSPFVVRSSDLRYASSWDWLIPVIKKFLAIPVEEFNYDAGKMAEFRRVRASLANMPISKSISDFYNELLAAISWYNENKAK